MKTQQDIINENIILQLEIRIDQDMNKIRELTLDRDAWITEYRAARAEVDRLKEEISNRDEDIEHYEYLIKQWGSGE
jgi:predicted  nucleic acid-binding Zn-ribbon protein